MGCPDSSSPIQVLALESYYKVIHQENFFTSEEDVYQVGDIPKCKYTEVPWYIICRGICLETIAYFVGSPIWDESALHPMQLLFYCIREMHTGCLAHTSSCVDIVLSPKRIRYPVFWMTHSATLYFFWYISPLAMNIRKICKGGAMKYSLA